MQKNYFISVFTDFNNSFALLKHLRGLYLAHQIFTTRKEDRLEIEKHLAADQN